MEATVNTIMNTLKAQIGDNGLVDVGTGAEQVFNTTRKRTNIAIALLVGEGYSHFPLWVDAVGGKEGEKNVIDVLAYKGATAEDVFKNRSEIQPAKWEKENKATPEVVKRRLAKLMFSLGRSIEDIAEVLGLSESHVEALIGEAS